MVARESFKAMYGVEMPNLEPWAYHRKDASLALLDNVPALPASRRLASAHAALAPKCELISARALSSFNSGRNA
jgi:hypothetical protein